MFKKKQTLLITGGTGSFGRKLVSTLLKKKSNYSILIYSRDEFKQHEMMKEFRFNPHLRFCLGDIRDLRRLSEALSGVDLVIHAAALKQVPAGETQGLEFLKTNSLGASNLITACIRNRVKRLVALSTDKACAPVNLYGATKFIAEKLFLQADLREKTQFSIVRYGNVIGSRGSVIPFFYDLLKKKEKSFPITHPEMTRFWITLEQGVNFSLRVLEEDLSGCIRVPRLPTVKIVDLAKAIAPQMALQFTGIRDGEKIHETLITSEESLTTFSDSLSFTIKKYRLEPLVEPFEYSSQRIEHLSIPEIQALLRSGSFQEENSASAG